MTIQSTVAGGALQVAVQDELTIYTAQTLKETFLNLCNASVSELVID